MASASCVQIVHEDLAAQTNCIGARLRYSLTSVAGSSSSGSSRRESKSSQTLRGHLRRCAMHSAAAQKDPEKAPSTPSGEMKWSRLRVSRNGIGVSAVAAAPLTGMSNLTEQKYNRGGEGYKGSSSTAKAHSQSPSCLQRKAAAWPCVVRFASVWSSGALRVLQSGLIYSEDDCGRMRRAQL